MTIHEIAVIIMCALLLVPVAFIGVAAWKVAKHMLDARPRKRR